jgi:hypothetical protein
MIFAVVPTHQHGRQRPKETMATEKPTVGHLMLYDWREGNFCNRALRVASLESTVPGVQASLLPKLFDAKVVKLTRRGLHIVGFEIDAEDGETVQYFQSWWAKPASPQKTEDPAIPSASVCRLDVIR